MLIQIRFSFHGKHSSDFTELRILEKEVARLKKEAKSLGKILNKCDNKIKKLIWKISRF